MPLHLVETGKLVPLNQITESPQKVREATENVGIADLAASIKTNGQIHAVSLIANGDGTFQLVNGHRRFTAARFGGLPYVRANVYTVPEGEEDNRELLIQQHLHAANLTESLNGLERARQFERVMAEFNMEVEQLPDIFKGETTETIRESLKLLNIDDRVIELVHANPDRFTPAHLRVLADYATPSTKGSWRMKPDEQVGVAEMLVRQEDKAAAADPRKFDAHIKNVVKQRRAAEQSKKAATRKPQADPVKALFKAVESVEAAVKGLVAVDLDAIDEIDAGDKGQLIKRVYDAVESLTSFSDDRVVKLLVRKAVS